MTEIIESKNLFDEMKPKKPIVSAILVMEAGQSFREAHESKKDRYPTGSCFVFDGNKLPFYPHTERTALKNIVFANQKWMQDVVNDTGFKDEKGNIWFFLPSQVLPNEKGTYWYREPASEAVFAYAREMKANKKELAKLITPVLASIPQN